MSKYATIKDIDEATRGDLLASLSENEVFLGGITATDALRPSRQTRLILTDQRLLTFKRKADTYPLTEIDRRTISSAKFEKGILTRKLVITGSDGFSQEWDLDINGANEFAEAVQAGSTYGVYQDYTTGGNQYQTGIIGNLQRSSTASDRFNENQQQDVSWEDEQSKTIARDHIQKGDTQRKTTYSTAVVDLSQTELLSKLQAMDDYDFEYFVADIWERMEWDTKVSQASVDAGIDVTATKSTPYPEKKVIQAKRYGENTTVGGPDIQQYASLKHQVAGADSVIVVTTGSFTNAAEERANELNVKTVDGEGLAALVDSLDARDLVAEYLSIPLKSQSEPTSDLKTDPRSSNETIPESSTATASNRVNQSPNSEIGNLSFDSDEGNSKILHIADRITDAADQVTSHETADNSNENLTNTNVQSVTDSQYDNSQAGNWHYGVIGLSAFSILALFAGISDIFGLSVLLLVAVTYLDIRNLRTATSEWEPRTWLYLPGMLFVVFIAAPVYLYRRKTAVGL